MLSHKYSGIRRRNLLKPRPCSSTWAAIKKGETVFKKGMKWIVGKNSELSFWNDKWLGDGTLRSLIAGPLQRGEDHLLSKDIVQHNFWNLGDVSFSLPNHLSQKIKATPILITATSVDRIAWASSPSGDFDLKEAYKLACIANDCLCELPFCWCLGLESKHLP